MSTPPRPSLVRHWLALAEELVGRAAPRLDALNLFPVPDADTGTNMLATLTAARTAADACPAQDDVGAVLAHAGAAALDSARGNSGMLLAVSLAGMAERLAAFGGEMSLSSPPGGPTRVAGSIPLLLDRGQPGV